MIRAPIPAPWRGGKKGAHECATFSANGKASEAAAQPQAEPFPA
jgi:hypothetical protein